ncbi:31985_t:CDS:1, partial [Gigaspora margarita]
ILLNCEEMFLTFINKITNKLASLKLEILNDVTRASVALLRLFRL